jgi:uncharacterized protein (DUF362 family)
MRAGKHESSEISRRAFLSRAAALGLGLAIGPALSGACAPAGPPKPTAAPAAAPPSATSQATSMPPPDSAPSAVPVVTTTSRPAAAYLAVTRGGDAETLVRRALAALGGMERFVQPGNDVIIKPNICSSAHTFEYAATTNPWVVGTLVQMCLECGAGRVRVMDNPFSGTADEAYARSGIREQVEAAGGKMEIMSSFKFVPTALPQGLDLRELKIYDDVLNADVLINVPIAKNHSLARLTLGMKNLMGTITGRSAIHQNMGQRLADLTSRIRPALTVIDAVRILTANGPTGGNLADVRQLDTVIASHDIVAADAYAARLFELQASALSYVLAGEKMGLGRSDLANVRVEEVDLG